MKAPAGFVKTAIHVPETLCVVFWKNKKMENLTTFCTLSIALAIVEPVKHIVRCLFSQAL